LHEIEDLTTAVAKDYEQFEKVERCIKRCKDAVAQDPTAINEALITVKDQFTQYAQT